MRPRSRSTASAGRAPSTTLPGRRAPFVPTVLAIVAAALIAVHVPVAGQTRPLQIAIVVHPQTPIDGLTFTEMRKVFRGERQYWTTKMPIVLLIRAPVALERELILKRVYEMSEAQFKQFWIAKIFRDEAAMVPKILYSNDQIADLVASIPGSISFVDAAAVRAGLKVLKIDGRLPGEPRYPLQ